MNVLLGFFQIQFNRLSNFPDYQLVCMDDLGILFLESLFTLVTHVLFCCLHLSSHTVGPVQICCPCIVLLLVSFTPHYTSSGPSADLQNHGCHLAAC